MAYASQPVKFTGQQASDGKYPAQPLILVGKIPSAALTAVAAPAAAAVPFANLTDAANSFNALRTALINAGILS